MPSQADLSDVWTELLNRDVQRSDILASALTESPAMVRPMGHTKMVPLHTRTFIGITGNPGVGSHNFFLEPGSASAEDIIGSVRNGFYVTGFMGHGVNVVTGDLSYGATGLWIENGELTFPVQGVTVAGNLKEMLQSIEMIGNDLDFRSSVIAPTLLIGRMTISA